MTTILTTTLGANFQYLYHFVFLIRTFSTFSDHCASRWRLRMLTIINWNLLVQKTLKPIVHLYLTLGCFTLNDFVHIFDKHLNLTCTELKACKSISSQRTLQIYNNRKCELGGKTPHVRFKKKMCSALAQEVVMGTFRLHLLIFMFGFLCICYETSFRWSVCHCLICIEQFGN